MQQNKGAFVWGAHLPQAASLNKAMKAAKTRSRLAAGQEEVCCHVALSRAFTDAVVPHRAQITPMQTTAQFQTLRWPDGWSCIEATSAESTAVLCSSLCMTGDEPTKHPPPSLSALHHRHSAKEDTGEDTEPCRRFNTCILRGHVIYLLGNCSSRHHEAWAPTHPSSGAE